MKLEIGSLVRHSSGTIGIVVFIASPSSLHHIEVWVPDSNGTRWWSLKHTEVL